MSQSTPHTHQPGQFVPTDRQPVPQHVKKKKVKKVSRKSQEKRR